MAQWGVMLLMIGIGSFILPFFGYQFVIVSAIGSNGGIICIVIGIALLSISPFIENSYDPGPAEENSQVDAAPAIQAEVQGMKQRAELLARLKATEDAADRAHAGNMKLLNLIGTMLSDIESRGTAGTDTITPLRAEHSALQAEFPAPFREALAEPYGQLERLDPDDALQETLARKLLGQHATNAAARRAWRTRAEQLNQQVMSLSPPKR